MNENGIERKQSDHRLADWACLAMEIAEALGYKKDYDIDEIFERMETERAAFTLHEEVVYQALKKAKAHENDLDELLQCAPQYLSPNILLYC